MKADVAVVGAGPAGSTAAALLARSGAEVVLLNREPFPRDKLCGEFLSYDALPILEELGALEAIDRAGAARIRTCRLAGDAGSYEIDLPREARGISRLTLDSSLWEHASAAGAGTLAGFAADRIERRGDRFAIEGAGETIDARLVIGAWGRWGRIDRQLDRPFIHDTAHRYFGFKRHYRGPVLDATIELHSFRGGYLGVAPIEGGLTNICGLAHQERIAGLRGGWGAFVGTIASERRALGALFAAYAPAQEEFLSSEPVIFAAKSAVQNGILLIGDAAGQLDPLTGNGMAMGIQSALLAASAARAILRGGDRERLLADYARQHAALFASRIRWSRRIAALLVRPALLDAALRVVRLRAPGALLLEKTRARDAEVEKLLDEWRRR